MGFSPLGLIAGPAVLVCGWAFPLIAAVILAAGHAPASAILARAGRPRS